MSDRHSLELAAGERDLRQRDFLLRAAQAISAPLDLREVLARVIRTAVSMTGGHAGAIALRQAGGELQIVASYRLDASFETHLEPWLGPSGDGADLDAQLDPGELDLGDVEVELAVAAEAAAARADRTASSGSPRVSEPAGERPGAIERSSAPDRPAPLALYDQDLAGGISVHTIEETSPTPEGPQQMLNLPLELAGQPMGRIFVFRSEGAAAFTPLDAELLQTFADQAAVAIQNADAHMRLAAREQRLASMVEHSPAGFLLLGAEGRVVSHNAAAAQLLGREASALTGAPAESLITMVDAQDRPLGFELPTGKEPATLLGHLRLPGGRRGAWAQVTATPLPDPRRPRAGWVVDLIDLSGYKEAEEARRAFLAGLSHELKTPLSLIRGYAETLRHPQMREDDALYEEAIDIILEETDHLTGLVDQLLTAARLEADALELDLHTLDLGAELERLVEGFRRAHPDHGWQMELAEDLPPVLADSARLREVFGNLLGNAAKYAPEGSEVHLRAAPEGSGLRVEVSDEGIGIDEADQARVFDRFFRASERGSGAGLGLYMARAITEAHGGRIDLASQPGWGSTFSVWLPAAPDDRSGKSPAEARAAADDERTEAP